MKAWAGMIPNGMPAQGSPPISLTTMMSLSADSGTADHPTRVTLETCREADALCIHEGLFLPPRYRRPMCCSCKAAWRRTRKSGWAARSLPLDVPPAASADRRCIQSIDVTKNHPSRRCANSPGAISFGYNAWHLKVDIQAATLTNPWAGIVPKWACQPKDPC